MSGAGLRSGDAWKFREYVLVVTAGWRANPVAVIDDGWRGVDPRTGSESMKPRVVPSCRRRVRGSPPAG
jgi:hypothetical protein